MNVSEPKYLDIVITDEFQAVISQLTKPFFVVSDTKVSSRMINYYQKQGFLFDTNRKEKTKRTFSAMQVIWIRVVSTLMDYGFSKENIYQIKRGLSADCLGMVSHFVNGSLLDLFSTYLIALNTDFRLIISRYPKDLVEGIITDSVKEIRFESFSHKTEFMPPSINEDITITIPLLPIANEVWKKLTNNQIEIVNGYYPRLVSHEKELIDKLKNDAFDNLTINKNEVDDGNFATFTKKIPQDDLKNIPKLLSMQQHARVTLKYGKDTGKVESGIIVNTIKSDSVKQTLKKIK
jgi:DNA-binding transcriptional MerR regulator